MAKACRLRFVLCLVLLVTMQGCSSVYYGTMEKLGYAKRDLMVSRVKEARDSQTEASQEFQTALEKFTALVGSPGSELEFKYKTLKSALDRSEASASQVRKRINGVEDVSDALFSEWKSELSQYKNERLKQQSARTLEQTKTRYKSLLAAMRSAESRLEPVLEPLRDNVLFLKHNLNAQAVGMLNSELDQVEHNVDELVAELNRSIAEANSFIDALPQT